VHKENLQSDFAEGCENSGRVVRNRDTSRLIPKLSGNPDLTRCIDRNHCIVRPSRLTSRVMVANKTLTDIPHIKTPMMLSSGPSMRQFGGRTMSP
jgi:hypothetical protein